MTFMWPGLFFSLLLIPLFVGGYFWLFQSRRKAASRAGMALGLAAGRGPGLRRHVPPAFFLLGVTLLLLALARPQAVVSLPRVEGTIILAFDVSGSMAATDLEPTRMEAAKAAARTFVQRQPSGMQIGVVAFSDSGFAVQAPTYDPDTILAAINRLTPQRATSLANGILMSLKTIEAFQNAGDDTAGLYSNLTPVPTPTLTPMPAGVYQPAIMILLTDGENTVSPDPMAAAQAAAERGVRIFTVGVGSPEGATLEVEGFNIHTSLDEAALQQIAAISGGAYYNARSEQDLEEIYQTLTPQLVVRPEKMEVTALFAGASLLCLLIGGAFSFVWFGRFP